MLEEFFEENCLFDTELIFPTNEEIDHCLKVLDNGSELSLLDIITLNKIKLIRLISDNKGNQKI